jgi:RimJ/RimL family protein N-acetyltransferase
MSGRSLLRALKDGTCAGAPALVLPVGEPVSALLRPIASVPGAIDAVDARLLSEWRNRHVKNFLTEFVATEQRTSAWLAGAIHADDGKMLFMLDALDGKRLGHLGIGFIDWTRSYGEADAIVSGGASPPGLMKLALRSLLRWANESLGLRTLAVRVRSDNPALDFYRKVGFVEVQRVPLARSETATGVQWVEDPSAAGSRASLVHMRYVTPAVAPAALPHEPEGATA